MFSTGLEGSGEAGKAFHHNLLPELVTSYELYLPSLEERTHVNRLPALPVPAAAPTQAVTVQASITQRANASQYEANLVLNTTTVTYADVGCVSEPDKCSAIAVESVVTERTEVGEAIPILILTKPPPLTMTIHKTYPVELQLLTDGGVPLPGRAVQVILVARTGSYAQVMPRPRSSSRPHCSLQCMCTCLPVHVHLSCPDSDQAHDPAVASSPLSLNPNPNPNPRPHRTMVV